MKKNLALVFIVLLTSSTFYAQNPLFIPDTLSGTNFVLNMHRDSVQFFPGQITYTYSYNQYKYFGPTLVWKKGDNLNITVNNYLGDTSTLHWHGAHVPPQWDGGPHSLILNNASWNPQFTVLDKASLYWYHPHTHMKTAEQALKGAAGMIIVRDSTEAALVLPRTYGIDDFPIAVQCFQFDSLHQIMPRGMEDSILLVNGTMNPYLNVPSQVVRMRLLNASGERTFNFGFTANKNFYMIGSDGGLLNAPVNTTRIRLSPGERAEILLDLSGMNGQTIHLMSYGSELPMGVQGGPTMPMPPGNPPMDSPLNGIDYNILQLNIGPSSANPVTTIPSTLENNVAWTQSSANAARTITFSAQSMMSMDGPFYFNGQSFDMMRIDYDIPLNNVEIWTLQNLTMVAHPFHMHDVQFYVLDRDGIPAGAKEAGRKDVVLVHSNETVRFITKFEDFADTITPYMYHCHILMHEDDGMMGQFRVIPPGVGIDQVAQKQVGMNIFPVPATSVLSYVLEDGFKDLKHSVSIYDLCGREIYVNQHPENNSIDISGLENGCYVFRIKAGDFQKEQRFVKNTP